MSRLPVLFISHGGGPWPFMDFGPADPYAGLRRYLETLPREIGPRPQGILAVSAHWEARDFEVMTAAKPGMLYDYGGFPEHTYRVQYPAPGSPELAERTIRLIQGAGLTARGNDKRAFDHGTFVPLAVSFPKADVPVFQLGIRSDYDPATHLALGRALEPLRSEGVLILASGLSYHNLRRFGPEAGPSSRAFDAWLSQTATDPDPETRAARLVAWEDAPSARAAHPREDHLVPLFVAAGAAGADVGRKTYSDTMMGAEVSGYQFG